MVVRRASVCICRSLLPGPGLAEAWLEGVEAGGGDSLLEGGEEVEAGCDGSLVLDDGWWGDE